MDINEIIEILQKPEVIHWCKLKNIGSIEFEKVFEKMNMELDYQKARSRQKHQAICIKNIKE